MLLDVPLIVPLGGLTGHKLAPAVAWQSPIWGSQIFGEKIMDIVLPVVFAAIFFYVLYAVIRAATRDGIIAAKQAERDRATSDAESLGRS
jgi:TRAP-type C4-dicarboxylate transport system permease small subunit